MIKHLVPLFFGIVTALAAHSQIVFLSNPPGLSNGTCLGHQFFNFNGTAILWAPGKTAVVEHLINTVVFNTIPNASIVAGAIPEPKVALLLPLAPFAIVAYHWRVPGRSHKGISRFLFEASFRS